jgi:hypothetical protein
MASAQESLACFKGLDLKAFHFKKNTGKGIANSSIIVNYDDIQLESHEKPDSSGVPSLVTSCPASAAAANGMAATLSRLATASVGRDGQVEP